MDLNLLTETVVAKVVTHLSIRTCSLLFNFNYLPESKALTLSQHVVSFNDLSFSENFQVLKVKFSILHFCILKDHN